MRWWCRMSWVPHESSQSQYTPWIHQWQKILTFSWNGAVIFPFQLVKHQQLECIQVQIPCVV